MRQNVATAAGDVNKRSFLAETESCGHGEHHSNRLDEQGPLAEIAPDNEPT